MPGTVVILTALPIEYQSVRAHLINPREETHPKGNVYERGVFSSNSRSIEVGIVQIRKGNVKAGVQTERAIAYFKPDIVFFVGVAGGLKDVRLGDVVTAEKIYGYESGKAKLSFQPRPDMGIPSFRMIERAQAEARKDNWLKQIIFDVPNPKPQVFIGPVAAGEKVVASKRSSIYKFLKSIYGDALLVEMEGYGFLEAAHANKEVDALVIRGISDLISGKSIADTDGWQEIASRHASAFAFEILSKLMETKEIKAVPLIPNDIQKLYDEGFALRDRGKYTEARVIFQKSLALSIDYKNTFAIAKSKYGLAVISNERDRNPATAKKLLKQSLEEFRTVKSEKEITAALYQLGVIEIDTGNLDQAEAYISQALDIDQKSGTKLHIAQDLHQLGWIEDHRGHSKQALEFYDQALNYFLSLYQEVNKKTEKEAIFGIAGCYQHKGLVYEHEGNVEEVESNYMRALEWHRKAGFNPDIGKVLFLLARFKYREAQYSEGSKYLDEALDIYNEIGDNTFYAKCLDLKGRLCFTLGQTDKANAMFESALSAVEKSGNYKEQEVYLNKLGHVYLEAQRLDHAKKYLVRAKDLSLREGLLDGYATSVKNLAQIAHIEKNLDERDRLLSDGIQTLERLLLTVQAEPKKVFLIGEIGFFYERMENFQQAIVYYQKAKKAFESLSDIGGIGNCLGSIARIKGLIGNKNEEFDTYRELKKLIDGTPYYDLIAGTAINLGEIQMQIGNLDEAKMLFREAEFLCRQFNLHYLPHLKKSIERLTEQINIRKPPGLNFKQLIHELFELTEWFPEAKDSILRLWMWGRKDALLSNYRSSAGVNLMVCQDNVDTLLKIAKVLHPYSDQCLQVISSKYPESGLDFIPFPCHKKMFFGGRYTLTNTFVRSKSTGNSGVTIVGWSPGLPPKAHQLILSKSAEELIDHKIFFLPYERYLANDKLLNDLSFCKEFKLIPIYFDSLPSSENIEVVTSKMIDLPILPPNDVKQLGKIVRKIKQNLSQLLSVTKDSAQSSLNNLSFSIEDLIDSCVCTQSIQIQVFILTYPDIIERELHVAMVITNA